MFFFISLNSFMCHESGIKLHYFRLFHFPLENENGTCKTYHHVINVGWLQGNCFSVDKVFWVLFLGCSLRCF